MNDSFSKIESKCNYYLAQVNEYCEITMASSNQYQVEFKDIKTNELIYSTPIMTLKRFKHYIKFLVNDLTWCFEVDGGKTWIL